MVAQFTPSQIANLARRTDLNRRQVRRIDEQTELRARQVGQVARLGLLPGQISTLANRGDQLSRNRLSNIADRANISLSDVRRALDIMAGRASPGGSGGDGITDDQIATVQRQFDALLDQYTQQAQGQENLLRDQLQVQRESAEEQRRLLQDQRGLARQADRRLLEQSVVEGEQQQRQSLLQRLANRQARLEGRTAQQLNVARQNLAQNFQTRQEGLAQLEQDNLISMLNRARRRRSRTL
jgi:hypothetical protein